MRNKKMEVNLRLDSGMHLVCTNGKGHETHFDTVSAFGGSDSAPTPMEIMLEALCACSSLDILSILRKKRIDIVDFQIRATGERAETHPKVITKAHLSIALVSPNATQKDLDRAIELSHSTYCGVSAMFRRSGAEVTVEAIVKQP